VKESISDKIMCDLGGTTFERTRTSHQMSVTFEPVSTRFMRN